MTRREWLAVAAASAACAPKETKKSEITLRVGHVRASQSSAPLYLAMERGYFQSEGLKIEPDQAAVTGLHVGALAAGKLDACLVAMSPAIVNAVQQGAPVRLVATRRTASSVCGGWGQLFAKRSAFPGNLKDFRELKGKRVAFTSPGSFSDFALDAILESAGLTRKDVRAVSIKRTESVAALLSDNLDAIMQAGSTKEIPPERRGEFTRLPGAELIYPKAQTLFIAFGERLRGADRAAGLGFLRAFLRASDEFFAAKHPEFTKKWAQEMGDPEAAYPNCPEEVGTGGAVDVASIKLYIDWALRRKHIETAIAPEAVIDATLLRDLRDKGPV